MRKKVLRLTVTVLLILGMHLACSKKKDEPVTPTTLTTVNTSSLGTIGASDLVVGGKLNITRSAVYASTDPSAYKLYCVTFSVPAKAGTGSAGTDGKFALKLETGKNKPFGCFILDSSDNVKATLVVKDTSQVGMGSDSAKTGQISFSDHVYLDGITVDTLTGTAVVEKSSIKKMDSAGNVYNDAGTGVALDQEPFDFSGTWQFATVPTNEIPANLKGYEQLPTNCQYGPCVGMNVFLKRVWGYKYANGVTSNEKIYGITVWETEAVAKACGDGTRIPLGVSIADAKTYGGVDFTNANLSTQGFREGEHTWKTGWTDGWKKNDATAQEDMWVVTGTDANGYPVWTQVMTPGQACSAITNVKARVWCYYRVYSDTVWGGGAGATDCYRRVELDWGKMKDNNNYTSESQLFRSYNGPTTATKQFIFEKLIYSTPNSASFVTIQEENKSESYFHQTDSQGNMSSSLTSHVFRYDTNGNTVALYNTLFALERGETVAGGSRIYLPGKTVLSYNSKYYIFRSYNCTMLNKMQMSFTKVNDTTLLGDWVQTNALGTNDSVCVAAANAGAKNIGGNIGTFKYIFKLNKQ